MLVTCISSTIIRRRVMVVTHGTAFPQASPQAVLSEPEQTRVFLLLLEDVFQYQFLV